MIWGFLLGTIQNIIGGRCNDVGPYIPPIQTASLGQGQTRGKVREIESVGKCQPLYIAWRGNRLRGVLFSSGPFKCHPRKYPSERVAQRKTGWLFCGGTRKKRRNKKQKNEPSFVEEAGSVFELNKSVRLEPPLHVIEPAELQVWRENHGPVRFGLVRNQNWVLQICRG